MGSAQPEYIGQALAVFLGILSLPFAYRLVRFIERSFTQDIIALAAIAPLAANAFARGEYGRSLPWLSRTVISSGLIAFNRRGAARYVIIATVVTRCSPWKAGGRKIGLRSIYRVREDRLDRLHGQAMRRARLLLWGKLRALPSSAVVQFVSVWVVALLMTLLSRDMGVLLLLWLPCVLLIGFAFSRREVLAGIGMLVFGAAIVMWAGIGPFRDRVSMWLNRGITLRLRYLFSSQMAQAFHRIASVPSPAAG